MKKEKFNFGKAVQGEEKLLSVFFYGGLLFNWAAPILVGLVLLAVSDSSAGSIWTNVFIAATLYHVLYVFMVIKNRHNRDERSMPAFSAIIIIGWPFWSAVAGFIFFHSNYS